MDAGAQGYLVRNAVGFDLPNAVKAIATGRQVGHPS